MKKKQKQLSKMLLSSEVILHMTMEDANLLLNVTNRQLSMVRGKFEEVGLGHDSQNWALRLLIRFAGSLNDAIAEAKKSTV